MDKILLIFMLVEILATVVECNTVPDITVKPNEDNAIVTSNEDNTTMTTVNSDGDKCALENDKIKDKNLGQGSVQPGTSTPQVLFEVKLLKNELMLLRGDVERLASIESRVDCLMSIQADGGTLDDKLNRLEKKLDSLESKLINDMDSLIDQKLSMTNLNVSTFNFTSGKRMTSSVDNQVHKNKESIQALQRELLFLQQGLKNEKLSTHRKFQAIHNDQDVIQEVQKDLTVLKQGLKSEKQSTNVKVQQISADIKKVMNDSQTLSEKFENMLQNMTEIDATVQENKIIAENLDAKVENLENVSEEMTKQMNENRNISLELSVLDKKFYNMESILQRVDDNTSMINSTFFELLPAMPRKRSTFSAFINEPRSGLRVGSRLIFDQVNFQTGTHYNVTSGVFTCPESAIYLFSVNISFNYWRYYNLEASLKFDSATTDIVFKRQTGSGGTVMIALEKGKKVWIQLNYSYSLYQNWFTNSTFNGELLHLL